MVLWKARCCCFESTYSSLLWLHFYATESLPVFHVGETVCAASGPEALFWALLLSDSQIHHPRLKLHTKGKKKKRVLIYLICKTL